MLNHLTRVAIARDGCGKGKKWQQKCKKGCTVVETDRKECKGEKASGLYQLEFEAMSSKDGGWYDVDTLLRYRTVSSGEYEVLVRYAGFSPDDDEWVKVKGCVRERSVPFEDSECSKIMVGNIVLCLQERQDHAIFYDALIVNIQRKKHDVRGCKCIFFVQYSNDNTEEEVRLERLCRRLVLYPETNEKKISSLDKKAV